MIQLSFDNKTYNKKTCNTSAVYPNYAKASDEDLRAIFTYLKLTQPVYNVVPAPRPPEVLSNLK